VSCSSGSVNLTSEAIALKEFKNPLSKYLCKKGDTLSYSKASSGLFGKTLSSNAILNKIAAQKGVNYYSKDDIKSTISYGKESVEAFGFSCKFKDVPLNPEAIDVNILKSDHVAVNCERIGEFFSSLYHDDEKIVLNNLKNITHERGGIIGNIEPTRKAGTKIGVYKCSPKQIAKVRIDMRRESREEAQIRQNKLRNYILDEQNRTLKGAYGLMQFYILNEL